MDAEKVIEKLQAAGLLSRLAQGMGGYEHVHSILEEALVKAFLNGYDAGFETAWGQSTGEASK